jgi:hypothetical protein
MTLLSIIIGLGSAMILLTAGYLLGIRRGNAARELLRTQNQEQSEELTRFHERTSLQSDENDDLRMAIKNVLTPLVERERLSMNLSGLERSKGNQRDLTSLLDQIADKGNFSAVLLANDQGWPMAASRETRDPDKLGAIAAMLLVIADRTGRDGTPVPLSLMLHDATNTTTLCRLFQVENHRLLLAAVSTGTQLTPRALDPALVKLNSELLNWSALA